MTGLPLAGEFDGWIPYPIGRLPGPLAGLCTDPARSFGVDSTFVLLPALAAAAGAIGRTACLDLGGGWIEPASLWSVLVAAPGSGKSPASKAVFGPAFDLEKRNEHERRRRASLVPQDDEQELDETAWRVGPALLADATTEALPRAFARSPRGVTVFRDELAGMLGGFDAYRTGAKGKDESTWAQLWSGGDLIVDRKSDLDPVRVFDPCASVFGNLTIEGASRFVEQHSGTGLVARFLASWPPPTKRPSWKDRTAPGEGLARWRATYERLASRPFGGQPEAFTLSDDAERAWGDFHDEHDGRVQSLGEGDPVRFAWSKLHAQCARLALVFHLVRNEDPPARIGARDMASAIEGARWFRHEVRRVVGRVTGGIVDDEELLAAYRTIGSVGGDASLRDLQRRHGRCADVVRGWCERLRDRGLVELYQDPIGRKGGRPSIRVRLIRNPEAANAGSVSR